MFKISTPVFLKNHYLLHLSFNIFSHKIKYYTYKNTIYIQTTFLYFKTW